MIKKTSIIKIVSLLTVSAFIISGLLVMVPNGTQVMQENRNSAVPGGEASVEVKPFSMPESTTHLASLGNYNGSDPWYSSFTEPAPMGIGFMGIGPNNQLLNYSTSSILGVAKVYNLTTYSSQFNSSDMTFQLNVNFEFSNSHKIYDYWVQEIAEVGTSPNGIYSNAPYFGDEIWNLTSGYDLGTDGRAVNMLNSTVQGNGNVSPFYNSSPYSSAAPPKAPGNNVVLSPPYALEFRLNASVSKSGNPELSFYYEDGFGWVEFDLVKFIFANDVTGFPTFLINYYSTIYSAGLVLTGPGGGSETYDENSNVSLQLQYWNGHNYQMPPYVYNFCQGTAESINNALVKLSISSDNGSMASTVYNGQGKPGVLYNFSNVSTLRVNSGLNSGTLYVNNTPYPFVGGLVNLTLAPSNPGYYEILLYNSQKQLVWKDQVTLVADKYYNVSLNLQLSNQTASQTYEISFNENGLNPQNPWFVTINGTTTSGQNIEFTIVSVRNEIIFSELNGTYEYSVSDWDNYPAVPSSGVISLNGANQSVKIVFPIYSVTFEESGLPLATSWSVSTHGSVKTSSTSSITFLLPNGNYTFFVEYIAGFASTPISGSFTVMGANVSIDIAFSPAPYQVTFVETGLPSGTFWTVTLNGINRPSTSSSLTFTEPNGTYSFSVPSLYNNYFPSPQSGTVTVSGKNVSESITFSNNPESFKTYGITFNESGLPSGTLWYVNLTNGQSWSSYTTSMMFQEQNGTYQYSVWTKDREFVAAQVSGSFTVDGAPIKEKISFIEIPYSVVFTESGLPSGATWNVTLNAVKESSPTSSITFSEPNGSYSYTVGIYQGYSSSPYTGSVTVNGAAVSVSVTFTQVKYTVTFTESGLVFGNWYVNITNQQSSGPISSSQISYSTSLPNGSYSYSVSTGNKVYKPSYSGTLTVHGFPLSESITFSLVTYTETFVESNLPSGTNWYVNLTNGQTFHSASFTIKFQEPNGSYSYTIASGNKQYRPSQYSGDFTVKGEPVSVSPTFAIVTFSVTFSETGLPSGTSWSIVLNGTSMSSSGVITFTEPNGTYTFTVSTASGYRASPASGTITVSGNSVSSSIDWNIVTYPLTITETGISSGASWSTTLIGTTFTGQPVNVTLSSTTGSITFSEPNGTYTYSVHLPSGYTGTNLSGSFRSTGQLVTTNITAHPATNYTLIIIVALIVIVAALSTIVVMMRRGKR